MTFKGRAFRAHDLRWSFSPLSGRGAQLTGGRFNLKGEAALYLSLDPLTALNEAAQGFTRRVQPLLLCEYDVDCDAIADLSSEEARTQHNTDRDALAGSWLREQRAARVAPSQALAGRLKQQGYAGAIVPSFAPEAQLHHINLVLWRWGPDKPNQVLVFDPTGRLPKNQLSWDNQ